MALSVWIPVLCHGREESDVTLLQRIHFEDLTLNYSRPKYPYSNILYIYLIHMSGVVFKIYGNTYLARLHYGLYTCMKPRMRSSNVLRLASSRNQPPYVCRIRILQMVHCLHNWTWNDIWAKLLLYTPSSLLGGNFCMFPPYCPTATWLLLQLIFFV